MSLLTPMLQLSFSTFTTGPVSSELPVDSLLVWAFRITFILLSLMLVIFSFVVIRQIKVMNETVTTVLGPIFRIISIAFFCVSILIALAAVTSL